jgi:hypothetical protein
VPQTRFIPAIVSNVISPEAQRHVLTLLRRTAHDKQRLAAALQVALPRYQKRVARVAFGPAQSAPAWAADSMRSAIVGEIRRLIQASAGYAEFGVARHGDGCTPQLQLGERALLPQPLSP